MIADSRPLTRRIGRVASPLVALAVLNGALTFHNIWPTLGIHWVGEFSVEIAALITILALTHALFGSMRRWLTVTLSVLVVVLVVGRYAEVTSNALYGRDVNLYWDLPNLGSVIAMLGRVASLWEIAGVCLAAVLALAILYFGARWCLLSLDAALEWRGARWLLGLAGTALITCFMINETNGALPAIGFSIPVTKTYATQAARIVDTVTSSGAVARLPASPALHSSFSALERADVLLIFEESYGRVTDDDPDIAAQLVPVRAKLAAAIHETRRDVVSAYVTSSTFGGSSWLAHISLLSGIDVRDPDTYGLLMMQRRPTLPSLFAASGYRTVAVMPGLHSAWPEARYYGFNAIYDAESLRYEGPAFGWWRIPDQYTLGELDARELQPGGRKPLFVFFPTISTHIPFHPTPPLQPDWNRVLTAHPFDAQALNASLTQTADWTDMGRSYARSVQYFFETISSYLRARSGHDFVLIILGDHQPAASVSGEGASWDVPVHVIASNAAVLETLRKSGFVAGLHPAPQAIGRMSDLTSVLLAAFDQNH